ncbi:MAG: hypothetical protein ACREJ2_17115, partial [Planctomycetota bacterium]
SEAAPPAWRALWQDAYNGIEKTQIDPERMDCAVAVDRTTGKAFLSMWTYGIWESSDGGQHFARVDGGKISGGATGPLYAYSFYSSPDGKGLASFNMNNSPGPSGYSLDGGKTWAPYVAVGRNWDFGVMDWDTKTVLAARHEETGLHWSGDGGQTWTRLARTRSDPWLQGLGVSGKALLVSTDQAIERSEDDGKTWSKVSDLNGVGPAVTFKAKMYWLSTSGGPHLIVSADQGKSWTQQGAAVPGAVCIGPFFGKDENHVLFAGPNGFEESTDGAKTWKLAVALPEHYTLSNIVQSAAYDPVHDVFYLANRSLPVMVYARSGKPAYAEPTVPSAAPSVSFVQEATAKVRCFVSSGSEYHGGCLYLAGEDGLMYFKCDPASGQLHFVEQQLEERCGGFTIRAAGDCLYGVTPHNGYHRMNWHGMVWYKLDPADGKPIRQGVAACPAARQIVVGPQQKNLYLKAWLKQDRLYWVHLGDDGKPEEKGEAKGKGIGPSTNADYPGILTISPDGHFLYTISAADYALAIVERKEDGSLAWKASVGLETIAPRMPGNERFEWTSLGMSPDGKYLYAGVRNGKPTDNAYGIFKRDAKTGELTLQETVSGAVDPLANAAGWAMVFAADGKTGFLGSFKGPLMTFQYDPASGHLTHAAAVEKTFNNGSTHLFVDSQNGLVFAGGREYGYDRVYVFRTAKIAANQ